MSRREVYAKDLQQYIDVDIYGACGKPAPRKGSPPINLDFRTELGKSSVGAGTEYWLNLT